MSGPGRRPGVLFLCVANSARSQMAEGLARAHFGDAVRVQSAGSRPSAVNPLAVTALAEVGIDASRQRSKSVEEIDPASVDLVDHALRRGSLPGLSAARAKIHWALPDPAAEPSPTEHPLDAFRDVRDELARRIAELEPPRAE